MSAEFTQEELRAYIEAQKCPWCSRGPFVSLSNHTQPVHGIDAFELKDMAGLRISDAVCSREWSEFLESKRKGQRRPSRGAVKSAPRRTTAASRESFRNNLSAVKKSVESMAKRSATLKATLSRITTCKKGHPFEGANLHILPSGKRVCQECARQRARAVKQRGTDLTCTVEGCEKPARNRHKPTTCWMHFERMRPRKARPSEAVSA